MQKNLAYPVEFFSHIIYAKLYSREETILILNLLTDVLVFTFVSFGGGGHCPNSLESNSFKKHPFICFCGYAWLLHLHVIILVHINENNSFSDKPWRHCLRASVRQSFMYICTPRRTLLHLSYYNCLQSSHVDTLL